MRLAVVVGATGGIGACCTHLLASRYDRVLAVSRRRISPELEARRNILWHRADLVDSRQREQLVDAIAALDMPIGALVVASGIAHRAPVGSATDEDWSKVLATNVAGPGSLVGGLVSTVRWADPAGIVFIGSLSARRALPDRSLYGASKAAIEHYARCIAVELAPRNIYVNTLSVGVTDTPFLEGDRARLEAYVAERIPAGRMIDPQEVAQAVVSLLGFNGAMVGSTVDLDGGTGVLG